MGTEQKIARTEVGIDTNNGLENLNELLSEGWKIQGVNSIGNSLEYLLEREVTTSPLSGDLSNGDNFLTNKIMTNLLNEFLNHKSDASNLKASQQEELQKNFQEWLENRKPSFEEAARPLMEYLGYNHHPHTSAYIRNDFAELLEGQQTFGTNDYILN
jgi:hypothetical protein